MITSRASEPVLRKVTIYSSEAGPAKYANGMKSFLHGLFPTVKFTVEPSPLRGLAGEEAERVATFLASSRMKDPTSEHQSFEPMYGEVDYELRTLEGRAKIGGIVYDGRKLLDIFAGLAKERHILENASIVLTDRLVSTYSRDDMRHHLRTIICGFPSIISIPGVVEAPAKPREYYLMRQRMEMEGGSELEFARLKTAFKGKFIEYGDSRLSEVAKGLGLQAVMYHLTLDPFCAKKDCRLFNAHWQKDLIASQTQDAKLCRSHSTLVARLGENPVVQWA